MKECQKSRDFNQLGDFIAEEKTIGRQKEVKWQAIE